MRRRRPRTRPPPNRRNRSRGGRQFIEPVIGMTSGGVRHVMRDDEGWAVCRFGELLQEPRPREPMLGQGIGGGEIARALAAADQAMVVNFPFGRGHRRRGIAGDRVIRPQRRPEKPQRRAASCDRCLAPVEHRHRPITRSEQCGAILSKAAAIIFVVSGHQDDTASEKVGCFARVRERRHIPRRM